MPASNREYWQRKIDGNRKRDRRTSRILRRKGWKVMRLWEHCLAAPETVAKRINRALRKTEKSGKNEAA